jgi:hypothetical protein
MKSREIQLNYSSNFSFKIREKNLLCKIGGLLTERHLVKTAHSLILYEFHHDVNGDI